MTRAGAMRETRAPHGSSPHRLRHVERMAPDDDVAASSGEHGSTTVTRSRASPRGTNSRPRQKGRPRADARTVPPCCSRATRASLCLAQRNPPMRRDVPLARPHPSSKPRRQPTQRAAPEPTADVSPKSRQPESSGRRKPTAVKDKIPPPLRGRARVRTCHSERPTCHSERSRGI